MADSIPNEVFDLIFGEDGGQRFTQDSPILPEVWFEFLTRPRPALLDLLFNPYRGRTPSEVRAALAYRFRIEQERNPLMRSPSVQQLRSRPRKPMVFNETHAVGELWFDEVVRCALPLTKWWREYVWRRGGVPSAPLGPDLARSVEQALTNPQQTSFSSDFLWLVRVVGYYAEKFHLQELMPNHSDSVPKPSRIDLGLRLMQGMPLPAEMKEEDARLAKVRSEEAPGVAVTDRLPFVLWSVTRNREASRAVSLSSRVVKADAAKSLFGISCKGIRWGIVDSGVDAGHPAFRSRNPAGEALRPYNVDGQLQSRVTHTYDFTKLRSLIAPESSPEAVWVEGNSFTREDRERLKTARERLDTIKARLQAGRMLNWEELEPFLRIPHDHAYVPPQDEHGTHVAGILAANWMADDPEPPPAAKEKPESLEGMCPDIEIYDLRVLDAQGRGTEFEVLAALQFVRYMNAHKDVPMVQGANLSLSIPHEVTSYACGRTPVCEECERLIGNGVVVVVAAGNKGYTGGKLSATLGIADYQDISITDPGNAEAVITVGATHREMPHTYGVSYFSSRGPTGDGRAKPDLVAPGEKIKSVIPDRQVKSMDGTSMAAPHVSGAAALLMARHQELKGQPARIKQILTSTATDLGRTRQFQGAGLVDILRAIQSV